jgi:hypothetical protein
MQDAIGEKMLPVYSTHNEQLFHECLNVQIKISCMPGAVMFSVQLLS